MNSLVSKLAILGPAPGTPLGTWNRSVGLESITCSLNPGHQRGGRRIGRLSVDLPKAVLAFDLAWTGQSDCLMRKNVRENLRSAGVTGFQTQPVEITSKGVLVEHDFEELTVTGWGGVADTQSGVKLLDSCPVCGFLRYSGVKDWNHLIDVDQWDGSDVSIVWPLPRYILVTEKVVNLLSSGDVSGFSLTPLGSMQTQEGELTPGRVSYWLPEETLRRIGVAPEIA